MTGSLSCVMRALRIYLVNVAIGLDQFANAIAFGEPDETISYRAAMARGERKRWGCVLCKALNVFQANHCDRVMINQNTRALPGLPEPME